MVGHSLAAVVEGFEAQVVQVEADVHGGYPQFAIVGLPDSAVTESRLRIRSAIRNAGYSFPTGRITVNLSPASMRKRGAGLDLAIAIAILRASGILPSAGLDHGFAAELGLNGDLVPIIGATALSIAFQQKGVNVVYVANRQTEAPEIPIPVVWRKASALRDVCNALQGTIELPTSDRRNLLLDNTPSTLFDFSQVDGHNSAKRALLIAATGRHHVFLVGPPGCGKTMLAERLPSILPPLTTQELIEVYAISERFQSSATVSTLPPLRMPHHSITRAGLIGSGTPPMPGEATFAHRGVLVFDELLEFDRSVLEGLREPLVSRCVRIARAGKSFTLAADFMFVATANPCPCGRRGYGECCCPEVAVTRYWSKFSGPLADRIDIALYVSPTEIQNDREFIETSYNSAHLQSLVCKAQEPLEVLQCLLRNHAGNAVKICSPRANTLYERAKRSLHLSRRGVDSMLRLALSIAALAHRTQVEAIDIEEALALRNTLGQPK